MAKKESEMKRRWRNDRGEMKIGGWMKVGRERRQGKKRQRERERSDR